MQPIDFSIMDSKSLFALGTELIKRAKGLDPKKPQSKKPRKKKSEREQSQSAKAPPLVSIDDDTPCYKVWTDGACEPNPGLGGWGYTMIGIHGTTHENFGGVRNTTNNRMELIAILEALRVIPDGERVKVYSDSQYAVKGLNEWVIGWKRSGWMRKDKKGKPQPLVSIDLWMALDDQKSRVTASFEWVRGHNGNEGNERADRLAALGRRSIDYK